MRALTLALCLLVTRAVAQDSTRYVYPGLPDSALANYQFPPGVTVTGDFPRMDPYSCWSDGMSYEETVNGPAPYWPTYAVRRHEHAGWTYWSSEDTVKRQSRDQVSKWRVYNVAGALEVLIAEQRRYRWLAMVYRDSLRMERTARGKK